MARVAPELAADWPTYRDLDFMLAGAQERRGNVSEVWGWLGGYDCARGYAADLFDDTQVAAVPALLEHTADTGRPPPSCREPGSRTPTSDQAGR